MNAALSGVCVWRAHHSPTCVDVGAYGGEIRQPAAAVRPTNEGVGSCRELWQELEILPKPREASPALTRRTAFYVGARTRVTASGAGPGGSVGARRDSAQHHLYSAYIQYAAFSDFL